LEEVVKRLNDDKTDVWVISQRVVEFLEIALWRLWVEYFEVKVIDGHPTLEKIFTGVVFTFFGLPIRNCGFDRSPAEKGFPVDNCDGELTCECGLACMGTPAKEGNAFAVGAKK